MKIQFMYKFSKEFSFFGNEYVFELEMCFEYLITLFLAAGLMFAILLVCII